MTNNDHTHSLNTIINPNYGSHNHGSSYNTMPYWAQTPIYYDPDVPRGKTFMVNGSIYTNQQIDQILHDKFRNEVLEQPTPRKQPAMSTIDKIKQERREKREREELETKFQGWDEAIGHPSEGDVWTFTADMSGKTYRYAVIFTNKQWYLTGQTVCGMAGEDFIAWLIERDVQLENFVFCEPIQ
jgi:hypothetical protein